MKKRKLKKWVKWVIVVVLLGVFVLVEYGLAQKIKNDPTEFEKYKQSVLDGA